MKSVTKTYLEFQTFFFLIVLLIPYYYLSKPVSIVKDRDVLIMSYESLESKSVSLYNTSDGQQCMLLSKEYNQEQKYYVVGNQCETYDRRMIDLTLMSFIFALLLNVIVSKRRVVEELVDEESGQTRSILSSKRYYEIFVNERTIPRNEYVELYFLNIRIVRGYKHVY